METQDSESLHEGAVNNNSSSSELKLQTENFEKVLKSMSKDIQYSMLTDDGYDHIFDLYKKWLEVLESYQVTHHQYIQIIEEADRQSYLYDHIDFQREIDSFRRYSEEWFKLNKPTPPDVKPSDSVSQLSRSDSSSVSSNSDWVREEQKRIELVEKRKVLEQKQKLRETAN
ncbi:hypothetical protein LOTGIDRAFT_163259 [Lottia gigantea]|uniref:Uncharacterized protein n=1 Tax=Lottia gigantea TaxID=225164 RepID=V4A5E0_LOTGI|nr:hypothetical protein LOTGIDRAFT_163255 [Lottia gigantea]XP_009057566.1 hypothetical protein LOTGIDRAFT_163259 [Lottia gigantea]ESO91893.1 hypothetical protein LOTGIDRAFT_163255 [Lottia gigantea]ESO91897.1 hypothetical protein LOTGIDRAFT_163259 [Lottia gigantea]